MGARGRMLVVAVAVALADRLSKWWVQANLPLGTVKPVIPGLFNLVHTENRGLAFGLFSSAVNGWRDLLVTGVGLGVLVLILAVLWKSTPGDRCTQTALALVLGGALGNLWDRLQQGAVTDFLDFYLGRWHWPAFNVADSAISVGALLLLGSMLLWPPGSSRHASEAD